MSEYLDLETINRHLVINGSSGKVLLGKVNGRESFTEGATVFIECSYLRFDELELNCTFTESDLETLDSYTYSGYWKEEYINRLLES